MTEGPIPGPDGVASVADLIARLKQLQDWAGLPSEARPGPGGATGSVADFVASCLRAGGRSAGEIDAEVARWQVAVARVTATGAGSPDSTQELARIVVDGASRTAMLPQAPDPAAPRPSALEPLPPPVWAAPPEGGWSATRPFGVRRRPVVVGAAALVALVAVSVSVLTWAVTGSSQPESELAGAETDGLAGLGLGATPAAASSEPTGTSSPSASPEPSPESPAPTEAAPAASDPAPTAAAPSSSAPQAAPEASGPVTVVARGHGDELRWEVRGPSGTHSFTYGRAGDTPVWGDWNGDGFFGPGFVRGNQWHLRHSASAGPADLTFSYGSAGDVKIVGDWNGNGTWTVGVVRGNTWYLRNGSGGGVADVPEFGYGSADDVKIVGDWDGNGTFTPGVVRGSRWYLRNGSGGGVADVADFTYGSAGDRPVVGDWNGNGRWTAGVVRGDTWHLRNSNTSGHSELPTFSHGQAGDAVFAGGRVRP